MADDRPLRESQILTGPLFNEPIRVETVRPQGSDACVVGLVGVQSGRFRSVTLTSKNLETPEIQETTKSYDGDGSFFAWVSRHTP